MNQLTAPHQFRAQFRQGLVALLEHAQPTPAMLVLIAANAIALQDQNLIKQVAKHIASRLNQLGPESNEDEAALGLIMDSKTPQKLIHHRTTPGGWLLQLNDLRAHRPKRSATSPATTVHQPYDETKFNFNRVPDETFWTGEWQSQKLKLYYNKYPIEPYHALLVPEPQAGHAQYLTPPHHTLAWDFAQSLAAAEPGIVVAYNALGAYASVNHLHFQTTLAGQQLPILQADLNHYPISAIQFTNPDQAWTTINTLQGTNQPFNALYLPNRILIIPRRFQGSYEQPAWTSGLAWYELSGGIITTDAAAYRTLTDADIEAAIHASAAGLVSKDD